MNIKILHGCPSCSALFSNFMKWNSHITKQHKGYQGDRKKDWQVKLVKATQCCNWVYYENVRA